MTAPKNPKPLGLPITIPAAEAIENMRIAAERDIQRKVRRGGSKVAVEHLKPAPESPFTAPPARSAREQQQREASYRVGDTTPSKIDLRKDIPGPMLLEVTQIDGYDHNPRIFQNERMAEIEASIRETGFHGSLVVTRRREGERYMLAAGSNTTLRILQRLWATTQNEKFRWVNCVYQPYTDETRLLAQHLGENLNRGDMKFWEIAKGIGDLLAMLQAERKRLQPDADPMSLREQAEALERRGIKADKTSIARWEFALSRLGGLGEASSLITQRVVDHLQPRLNALRNLSERFSIGEAQFWPDIVNPVLASHGAAAMAVDDGQIDPQALGDEIESAVAAATAESPSAIRQMLSQLKLSPKLTLAELRMPSPNLVVGRTPPVGAQHWPGMHEPSDASPVPAPGPVAATQRPLPIPPGMVGGTQSASVQPPSPPSASQPAQALAQPSVTAAQGDLPLLAPDDALDALHETVKRVLSTAGLLDTFRPWGAMPMGFYLEMPDPMLHARRKVPIVSPAYEMRQVKTIVWWNLVLSAGQYQDGVVPYLDQNSTYYRVFSSGADENPLEGTDIERSHPPLEEFLTARVQPGVLRLAIQGLREFEEAAARLFDACPERWALLKRLVSVLG